MYSKSIVSICMHTPASESMLSRLLIICIICESSYHVSEDTCLYLLLNQRVIDASLVQAHLCPKIGLSTGSYFIFINLTIFTGMGGRNELLHQVN